MNGRGGLPESVYEMPHGRSLEQRGFHVERREATSFKFDGLRIEDRGCSLLWELEPEWL